MALLAVTTSWGIPRRPGVVVRREAGGRVVPGVAIGVGRGDAQAGPRGELTGRGAVREEIRSRDVVEPEGELRLGPSRWGSGVSPPSKAPGPSVTAGSGQQLFLSRRGPGRESGACRR